MKKNIFILFGLLYSLLSLGQNNTKITIKIPQSDPIKLEAQIFVENPMLPINTGFYQDTLEVRNGQCQFSFELKNTSYVTLTVNEQFVTFPGTYGILVEPGDDLLFDLPAISNADIYSFGITKLKISGKGSEKINLTKNMIVNCFKIFDKEPDYQKQTLSYKFESTDRKLNAVDFIYNSDKNVKKEIKDLAKALLYSDLMVSLYRSSLRSDNDSLRFYFNKYIVNKKRMDIFFQKGIIQYSGAGSIGSYLILSAYKNPVRQGGDDFPKKHRIEYAGLLTKGLKNFPEMRDYVLSKFLRESILRKFDSTTVELYQYYIDHVNFNNPNYTNVANIYEDIKSKFEVGKPFYNFSLPDSTGKIFSLSDFKGKVLVIDFWYNGCGGCKLMIPAIQKAESELAGTNVQFISIGIDSRNYWLKGIGKYSSENSLQLYTNEMLDKHPMIRHLKIYSYPKLIVVDKNGNIGSPPPDPRDNKPGFVELLKSYL